LFCHYRTVLVRLSIIYSNAIRYAVESKGSQVISAIKKDAQELANKFINNNNGLIQFSMGRITCYSKYIMVLYIYTYIYIINELGHE
jgi:hypothetical protein